MNSIFHRISVRKYEDKPVEKEKIMEILKAGMQAPSACNQQPWEFYVVTDKEKIQKLSKVTPYTGCAAGAPAVIVPVYHTEGLVAPSFAQIDMSIAQENIWLETDTLGLGGVWFGIAPVEEHMEKVHRLLDLPENVKVFSQSSLGRIMAQENLPSLITLEKICTALGVTLSQFFQEGNSENLTEKQKKVLGIWIDLSTNEQETVMSMPCGLRK